VEIPLDPAADSPSSHQRDDEQNQEHDEDNFRDSDCCSGDTAETQDCRHQRNDQKR